jgi:hypothetical protein
MLCLANVIVVRLVPASSHSTQRDFRNELIDLINIRSTVIFDNLAILKLLNF